MHPITDYIPAIALMVASIAIPKESSSDRMESEGQERIDEVVAVDSAKVSAHMLETRPQPRIRLDFDSLARPGINQGVDRAEANPRLQTILATRGDQTVEWIETGLNKR